MRGWPRCRPPSSASRARNGKRAADLKRPLATLLTVAAITLVADQVTKALVRAHLSPSRAIVVIPGVFEISYIRNTGAAFGVMAGKRLLFVAVTMFVLAGIAWVWVRYRPRRWLLVTALGLVTAGALGNLIDRVLYGQVTDFLYVHYWPVFNVADSAVVVGVAILVVWLLFFADDEDEPATEAAPPPSGDDSR